MDSNSLDVYGTIPFDKKLKEIGFHRLMSEPCVYIKKNNQNKTNMYINRLC